LPANRKRTPHRAEIDARRGPGGETLIYVLSDDNANPLQRTYLLMFELIE
jgi:hypothetical protein